MEDTCRFGQVWLHEGSAKGKHIFKPIVLSSKPVEEAMTPFPEAGLSFHSLYEAQGRSPMPLMTPGES
jgi:hypothetical protein